MKFLKWFAIVCFSLFSHTQAFAQNDININVKSAYIDLGRSLTWGSSGGFGNCQVASSCGFNNNFLFTPLNPDQGICIFITNNNPTNSHTFTIAVSQTGDQRQQTYTGSTGRFVTDTVQGTASPVGSLATTTVYVHTTAGARVVIQLSGSSSAAGTPDTADVYLVQTSATSCGPVQNGVTQVSINGIPSITFSGAQPVNTESTKSSYRVGGFVTPTGSVIYVVINGSATKTISINYYQISCQATSATNEDMQAVKRSTLDSGGTSISLNPVANDSNDPAATATVLAYTAAPTLGNQIGIVNSDKLFFASAGLAPNVIFEQFGIRNDKTMILRGATQEFEINSAVPAGGTCDVEFGWTEF